ncbi:MAG: thiolase family protein [Acidimicrobiia bacterium]|nr:thiolase family protein [Acidimicrobiia bacterium]MYE68200.1 thiolase family protein [Acidimicrobiia bacterium]
MTSSHRPPAPFATAPDRTDRRYSAGAPGADSPRLAPAPTDRAVAAAGHNRSAAASVWGVGTSRFARQPETPPTHLAWQAVTEALADAGVTPGAVEAVYAGTVFGDPGVTTRTLQHLGITGVPVVTIENACASGTTAFHEAQTAVTAGRYECVLAFGIETMTSVFDGPIEPLATDPEGAQGFAMPSLYGMAAHRYQHCHGVTPEQMALVAVKNRRHALGNPRAQHAGELTVEQVLGSRPISDPLTLLQCCDISDAAAAAVVGPPRRRAANGSDVAVRASALASGRAWDHTSDLVWGWQLVSDVARAAFEQAGVGPGDVDVFEVHDAFTIGEIVTTEALGLCELGGGGELVASGRTSLGGAQPVNPSGGLLARGHPLGATGLGQLAEIVWQLRGAAEGRQVAGARLGVVETMGGGTAGIDGNACVVAVLEAPEGSW